MIPWIMLVENETKSGQKKRRLVRRKAESDSDGYVDDGAEEHEDDDEIVAGMLRVIFGQIWSFAF
jgi:hypothetical protein